MNLRLIVSLLTIAALSPLARADGDPVAVGRDLAVKHKCSMCHKIDDKGGKMGQPLNGIAKDKTDDYLRGSLMDPKATIDPKTKMPSYKDKLTAEEVEALIAYMKSLN